MEAKHTPGPWTVSDHDTTQIRGAGPDYRGDIATVHISRDPERMDADALLIASAPDILSALEDLAYAAQSAYRVLDARVSGDIRNTDRFTAEAMRASYGKALALLATLSRGASS